jgi:uncharacterized protein YlzI (FlbEa/FlbD family)
VLYPKTADVMVVDQDGNNLRDKMIAINEQIEVLSDAAFGNIDLSKYVTKEEVAQEVANKVNELTSNIIAEDVKYSNKEFEELNSVASAIDYLLANNNSNIIFDWENMQNKPQLANKLELTQSELILKSDDDSMSSVPLMEDNDIDIIISQL